MSDPKDHHYLPVFYLNRWRSKNQKVVRFYRPHDRVVASWISPENTGFEPGLYSLDYLPQDRRQIVETKFFNEAVDSPAAVAIDQLLENRSPRGEVRSGFARFVWAMRLRNPLALQEMKARWERRLREQLNHDVGEYEAARRAGDPATLYEWACEHRGDEIANFHKSRLPHLIDNEKVCQGIMDMTWNIVDYESGTTSLLTGDRPFITTHGLGDPAAHLLLPLSPTKLFIGSNRAPGPQQLRWMAASRQARVVNHNIVCLAAQHVYGNEECHLPYVESNLIVAGQTPVPSFPGLNDLH